MPLLTEKTQIRARLERDRPWSAYALGDLAPGFWDAAEWYGTEEHTDTVVLVYRRAEPPILLICGDTGPLPSLLRELPPEPELMLSIRPEALESVRSRWLVPAPNAMWRMLLTADLTARAEIDTARALDLTALPAVQELFRDGRDTGEEPDFFQAAMLRDGVYFGVWEGESLVAAAGTHLAVQSEDVATIGNVYVRRDRRGRGLARSVTGAVVRELQSRAFGTIALNVRQSNIAAIRVYEHLGFRRYCPFFEGRAYLRSASGLRAREELA